MYIIYDDNEVRIQRGRPKPYHEQDAVGNWLRHYSNGKYLTFFVQHETDLTDRLRAQHELTICERKMAYWKRHMNWNAKEASRAAEPIDKMWRSKS